MWRFLANFWLFLGSNQCWVIFNKFWLFKTIFENVHLVTLHFNASKMEFLPTVLIGSTLQFKFTSITNQFQGSCKEEL